MNLTDEELSKIDRNRLRLAKIGDRGRTADLFARVSDDELTLVGEMIREATRTERRLPDDGQTAFL